MKWFGFLFVFCLLVGCTSTRVSERNVRQVVREVTDEDIRAAYEATGKLEEYEAHRRAEEDYRAREYEGR